MPSVQPTNTQDDAPVTRSAVSRRDRGRRSAVLASAALAGAGLVGATVAVAPAAATAPSSVTVHEDCQFTIAGVPQDFGLPLPLTLQVATVAPTAVAASQPFTVTPTVTFEVPVWLASAALLSPATIQQVALTVGGSDVTPASQVATATTSLPIPGSFVNGSQDTVTLSPVSFTAGAPGTAVLSAGGAQVGLQLAVLFGSLGTVPASITCTVDPGQPALATVLVAQQSTVPVGAAGGGLLAGTLGVGAVGAATWRRRARRSLGSAVEA